MAWLKQLFSRRKIYSDLSEEIRQHLDEKVAEFISGGMSPEEAQHRARRDFGNVTLIEERSREAWQWPTFESCWADTRDEIRQLRKRPALAAIIVLTFGLGIGASTATFSVADAFLFRPLGLPDSEHLVSIHHYSNPTRFWHRMRTSQAGRERTGPLRKWLPIHGIRSA